MTNEQTPSCKSCRYFDPFEHLYQRAQYREAEKVDRLHFQQLKYNTRSKKPKTD